MRVWSVHPRYLDRQGLIACWRETLLAQAVLAGRTRGYTSHPQLERFRAVDRPLEAVGAYLEGLAAEADERGYRFDRSRIDLPETPCVALEVTTGQLSLEWAHLSAKLAVRDPERRDRWRHIVIPDPHPLFGQVPGDVASWERARPPE